MIRTAGLVLLTLLASACEATCSNKVGATAVAPGGKHSVAMFSRDCGATTGFSTQVSVLDADAIPTEAGNVFVADKGAPMAWGGPRVEIAWLAPDRLLVRYDSRARVFKKVDRLHGVTISYAPVMR